MKSNLQKLTIVLIIISIGALFNLHLNPDFNLSNVFKFKESQFIDLDNEFPLTPKPIDSKETFIKNKISFSPENTFLTYSELDNNVVIINGKILFPKNNKVRFYNEDTSIYTSLDIFGQFNLSFPIKSGNYVSLFHGDEVTQMWCKPLDTIFVEINTKEFDESVKYEGSEESNYLAWKYLYQEESTTPDIYNLTINELSQEFDQLFIPMKQKLNRFKTTNDQFYYSELTSMEEIKKYYINRHAQVQNIPKVGEPGTNFSYPNRWGVFHSLDDMKGSYVYVDIWATWCGPCRAEAPYWKELYNKYSKYNIEFVSISVDTDSTKWAKYIVDYGLTTGPDYAGIQLWADGWSQITKDYAINGIPRFMLFDTSGNVISVDAPRPSSKKIHQIFDKLNLSKINNLSEEYQGCSG